MPSSLKNLCEFANQDRNRHRQPVPGYETSHVMYKSRAGLIFFISNQLPRERFPDGWQFYISIRNPKQLERAWRAIHSVLLADGAGTLGMSTVDISGLDDEMMRWDFQHGKTIILYTFKDQAGQLLCSPSRVFNTLRQIEEKLSAKNIHAGPLGRASQPIKGSSYLSLRQAHDPMNVYIEAEEALYYDDPVNPFNQVNPYQHMQFNLVPQRFFDHARSESRMGGHISANRSIGLTHEAADVKRAAGPGQSHD